MADSISIQLPSKENEPISEIPKSLIKEVIDGIPFYYKGYRSVLNKTRKLQDIMPDSGLQTLIKNYLHLLLATQLGKDYYVFVGEIGSHIDRRNNLALDLTIFEKKSLPPNKITTKYIDVTPKIVIEVDVNVELPDQGSNLFEDFVLRKVRKLHEFGTEKIIWIFTKSKTVVIALSNNDWKVVDLDNDIEVLNGISFNIAQYLKEEGFEENQI